MSQSKKLLDKVALQARRLKNKLRMREFSYSQRLLKAKFDSIDFIDGIYKTQRAFTRVDDEAGVKEVITLTIEAIKHSMESFGLDNPDWDKRES